MSRRDLDAAVAAYRALTDNRGDVAVTRARVLGQRSRRARSRRVWVLAAMLGTIPSAWAAWRWTGPSRAATTARPSTPERRPSQALAGAPAAALSEPTPNVKPAPTLTEADAYARAHAAHFHGRDPRGALAAWDEYLRLYPAGDLAIEARYNRAICLVKMGAKARAVAALRPFAAGEHGSYRRDEARALLERLR